MTAPGVSRYDRYGRLERAVLITCCAGLVALSVGLILIRVKSDGVVVNGLGALLALVTTFWLVRVFRVATIDISGESVIVRGLLSTARFRLADVERFTVVSGFDQTGNEKRALGLRRRSGEERVFPDFSAVGEAGGMRVRELAGRLNEQLEAFRISTRSSAA